MAEPFEVEDAAVAKLKGAVEMESSGAAQAILKEVGPCGFDSLMKKTDAALIAAVQKANDAGKALPPLITSAVRQVDVAGTNEYIVNLVRVDVGMLSSSIGPSQLFASYLDKSCKEKK